MENRCRKVTYIWKIELSWRWTFDDDSDFVSFLTLADSSNQDVFVDVWLSLDKSIGELSMVYKKWVLWYGLGSIITILTSTCNLFNSTTLLPHAYILGSIIYSNRTVTNTKVRKASATLVTVHISTNLYIIFTFH